jgi:Na+/H+ antiporter NhaD/arsenite permease-like protein
VAWSALAVFGLSYVFISGGRLPGTGLDRVGGALAGAVAMVALGVVPAREVVGAGTAAAVDWDTLLLLLGMLVLSTALLEDGSMDGLAARLLARARTPRALLAAVCVASAVLSAFLVNDTVCLVLTPLVLAAVRRAALPPLPYLLAVCMGANAGSVATFTGNPQNMIIQVASGLPYARWAAVMTLPALVATATVAVLLDAGFRRELDGRAVAAAAPGLPPRTGPAPWVPTAWILGGVVAAFFAGLPLGWSALGGAAVVLAVRKGPSRALLQRVDFVLLLFFASLFVLVHGLHRAGWADRALQAAAPWLSGGAASSQALAFSALSFAASNIFSNVPYVMLARHWVPQLEDPLMGWHLLGLASTLAGNLTLVGSVANLIVFELAREDVEVTFWGYARVGIPVTLASLAAALGVLLAERALHLF